MVGEMHVRGFSSPDESWRRMKAAWDACVAAGVKVPKELYDFFGDESPDAGGAEVAEAVLVKAGAVVAYGADMREGVEILIDKVPKGVKVVRVYKVY